MPTSVQVKIVDGSCCCDLPLCCADVEMPENLCVFLRVGQPACPSIPPTIKISRIGTREWYGRYCLPNYNIIWDARLTCIAENEWSFTVQVFTCSGTLIPIAVFSFPLGGMNASAACSQFLWSGAGNNTITLPDPTCGLSGVVTSIRFVIQSVDCPDNGDGTGSDEGTATGTAGCLDCGTGTGTSTGTSCPCPTDDVFCADDGYDLVTLTYSSECMWAGGSTSILFFPNTGTVTRGVSPANFASYTGPTGCGGGTYTQTAQAGPGPHPLNIYITPGECSGTATGTGTGCPCDLDTLLCATGNDYTANLIFLEDCLWVGNLTLPGTGTADAIPIVYDPRNGVIRIGSFPDSYADYSGPATCGGTYNKTFTTGPIGDIAPEQIVITEGECP